MQPTQESQPGLEDTLKAVEERLGPRLQEAQAQLKSLNEQVKTFVRKNPGVALAGAIAVGFLVGRWASRK
jgi:ElaB/YqjD/DUF883 family membrane-anchored ribosome-binding protein